MTLHLDAFNAASTAIHASQGCALLVLGLTEIYSVRAAGGRIRFASPVVFMLSGAAMALAMLYFLGGWSVRSAALSLKLNGGFCIFVSFACFYASAGLSQLTFLSSDEKGRGWHYLFLIFLSVIGLLYFGMSRKVNPAAAAEVAAYHSAIGFTLLAAVVLKYLNALRPRRIFNLAWIALLFISSYQLLSYREVPGAFDLRTASLRTSSQLIIAPGKAAKPRAAPSDQNTGVKIDVKAAHPKRADN